MKDLTVLSVLIVSILFMSCRNNDNPFLGYWEANIYREGHHERYVYHITTGFLGSYKGSVQSYIDSTPLPVLDIKSIKINNSGIEIKTVTSATITYKGKLNKEMDQIKGRLIYPDNTTLEMNLIKRTASQKSLPKTLNQDGDHVFSCNRPEATGPVHRKGACL